MTIKLTLTQTPDISIEADCINTNITALSEEQIKQLKIWQGNRQINLEQFFSVEKTEDEQDEIHLYGQLEKVKRLAENNTKGKITIHGSCGMHTGENLKGGEIEIHGNVADWCFGNMMGGTVKILGNAGAFLASAFPGDAKGIKGGAIYVQGNTGDRMAERMRKGLIVVGGTIGELAGVEMIAGTIISLGHLGARAGGNMKRGTIVAMGTHEEMVPGFLYSCTYSPAFVPLMKSELKNLGIKNAETIFPFGAKFQRWCGDTVSLAKGEILTYVK